LSILLGRSSDPQSLRTLDVSFLREWLPRSGKIFLRRDSRPKFSPLSCCFSKLWNSASGPPPALRFLPAVDWHSNLLAPPHIERWAAYICRLSSLVGIGSITLLEMEQTILLVQFLGGGYNQNCPPLSFLCWRFGRPAKPSPWSSAAGKLCQVSAGKINFNCRVKHDWQMECPPILQRPCQGQSKNCLESFSALPPSAETQNSSFKQHGPPTIAFQAASAEFRLEIVFLGQVGFNQNLREINACTLPQKTAKHSVSVARLAFLSCPGAVRGVGGTIDTGDKIFPFPTVTSGRRVRAQSAL